MGRRDRQKSQNSQEPLTLPSFCGRRGTRSSRDDSCRCRKGHLFQSSGGQVRTPTKKHAGLPGKKVVMSPGQVQSEQAAATPP